MGPVCHCPEVHVRRVQGGKVQEVGIKHDCTRTDEEFSPCDLLDVCKKVSAPVYEVSPVSILLSSVGVAKLH